MTPTHTLRAILQAIPHPGGLVLLDQVEQQLEALRHEGACDRERAEAAERDDAGRRGWKP